jgi:hypothetical protein
MLVVALLNKDFNKRPSIIEVANLPCVKKEILDFIEENDIMNEVINIIDLINPDDGSSEDEKDGVEKGRNSQCEAGQLKKTNF